MSFIGLTTAGATVLGGTIAAGGALGAAALSNRGGGGGGGSSQVPLIWPKIEELPKYSFTEPRLELTSDFLTQNLERLQRGEYPQYYDKALPTLRENLARPLRESYYGRPGERTGVLQGLYDVGSITGLGPANVGARVSSALLDYATKEKQIDEYLTKLGVDIMFQDAGRFPQMSMNMPKGPDTAILSPFSPPQVVQSGRGSGIASALGTAAGAIGYGLSQYGQNRPLANRYDFDYTAQPLTPQNSFGVPSLIQPRDPYANYTFGF